MNEKTLSAVENIGPLIRTIRGQKVILDSDLARIFKVRRFVLTRRSNVIASGFLMISCFN
jgi:hypothetical protein